MKKKGKYFHSNKTKKSKNSKNSKNNTKNNDKKLNKK